MGYLELIDKWFGHDPGEQADPNSVPEISNYYSYDSEGNLIGSTKWDGSKNGYVYNEGEMSPEEQKYAQIRDQLSTQMLQNLSETPEDRVAAYQEYRRVFSDIIHEDVDEEYDKQKRTLNEEMNAKGMTGSSAWVDNRAELRREKQDINTDIAQRSYFAAEDLKESDRRHWISSFNMVRGAKNNDRNYNANREAFSGAMADTGTKLRFNKWQGKLNAMNYNRQTRIDQFNQWQGANDTTRSWGEYFSTGGGTYDSTMSAAGGAAGGMMG